MYEELEKILTDLPDDARRGHYLIPGDPIPLARARFTRNHVYDAQKHLKVAAGLYLAQHHKGKPLFEKALALHVYFFMPIPHSKSLSKRKELLGARFKSIPDLSNLVKFVEDTAIGILYTDDRLISDIHAYKIYDSDPRTEFILHEIPHG